MGVVVFNFDYILYRKVLLHFKEVNAVLKCFFKRDKGDQLHKVVFLFKNARR